MITQQSSWMMSFGIVPPPVTTQEKPEIEIIVRAKSFVRNESIEKAKIIKKMKLDIVEAMERGIGRWNTANEIYFILVKILTGNKQKKPTRSAKNARNK